MPTQEHRLEIRTHGFSEVLDITGLVQDVLDRSELRYGICLVAVPGSTASVTTIEFESGVVQDLRDALERMAPRDQVYRHDARWGDGNGFSHVRAALMGPSLSVPFSDGKLRLGTWQQVVLVDHDNRPRSRALTVHLVGE